MEFDNDIISCLEVLRQGGIILYPTDTVWGLGCDATNELAVQKIYQLKQRPQNKSAIVLLGEFKDVNRYTSSPEPFIAEYLEQITKPTTVIYEGAIGLADSLIAEDGSIAIRIVQDDFCRHLIKRLRKPLVSTSANVSGQHTPPNFESISEDIIQGVDYVVKYRQNDPGQGRASSLIRFNQQGLLQVLRS